MTESLLILGVFALFIVVAVATTAYRRPRHPLFWVAFPVTLVSTAVAVEHPLPLTPASALNGWLSATAVPGDPVAWVAVALLGAVVSVVTWRSVEE